MTPTPLSGIRVLELARYLPGPLLCRLLAEFGAEILKVEPPGGDAARLLPPLVDRTSPVFSALNVGKRSAVVDLKKPEGATLFAALVERADVVVESFRPGVLERLGFGYDALRANNPRIILCSVSGYGQEGELRHRAGHDLNYAARSGLLWLLGRAGQTPPTPGMQMADVAGGSMMGAMHVMAALMQREKTGEGCHLDISMTHQCMFLMSLELARRTGGAGEPRGEGLLCGGWPCYGVFETKDHRYMALAAVEPKFFAEFCRLAQCPELVERGLSLGDAQTVESLKEVFSRRTQREWVDCFGDADVCCEPVRAPEEVAEDPQVNANLIRTRGTVAVGVQPPRAPLPPAPEVGEHGEAAVSDWGVPATLVEQAVGVGALGTAS